MSLQENWKEEHTSGSPVCFAGPGGSLRGPVGKASIVLRPHSVLARGSRGSRGSCPSRSAPHTGSRPSCSAPHAPPLTPGPAPHALPLMLCPHTGPRPSRSAPHSQVPPFTVHAPHTGLRPSRPAPHTGSRPSHWVLPLTLRPSHRAPPLTLRPSHRAPPLTLRPSHPGPALHSPRPSYRAPPLTVRAPHTWSYPSRSTLTPGSSTSGAALQPETWKRTIQSCKLCPSSCANFAAQWVDFMNQTPSSRSISCKGRDSCYFCAKLIELRSKNSLRDLLL